MYEVNIFWYLLFVSVRPCCAQGDLTDRFPLNYLPCWRGKPSLSCTWRNWSWRSLLSTTQSAWQHSPPATVGQTSPTFATRQPFMQLEKAARQWSQRTWSMLSSELLQVSRVMCSSCDCPMLALRMSICIWSVYLSSYSRLLPLWSDCNDMWSM